MSCGGLPGARLQQLVGAAEVAVLALQLRVQRRVVLRRDVQLGQMLQLQKYYCYGKYFNKVARCLIQIVCTGRVPWPPQFGA